MRIAGRCGGKCPLYKLVVFFFVNPGRRKLYAWSVSGHAKAMRYPYARLWLLDDCDNLLLSDGRLRGRCWLRFQPQGCVFAVLRIVVMLDHPSLELCRWLGTHFAVVGKISEVLNIC